MRRKTVACLLLMSPWLAGCGLFQQEPQVSNPAPPGVSFRAENGDVAATAKKAQEYCGRYGKKAKQENVSKASDSTIVQYSCS